MGRLRKKGKKRTSKPSMMPGFDYGLERSTAVMTAPVFNEEIGNADIIACAYGQTPVPGVTRVAPCISMVARRPGPLKEAFKQFHAWIQATGPDALKVEILYSTKGYYISFTPDYQHTMWRTVGIDQFVNPAFFGVTYIKTIDSRHAFLDDFAEYSKRPVAPVVLLGAQYIGSDKRPKTPNPSDIKPIADCPELLLYNLPVYKTNGEVSEFSGLRVVASKPTKEELDNSRKEYEQSKTSPDAASRYRERRLACLMPVTLHMLRTYAPLQPKLAALDKLGVARWQVEQAIINQRLWSQVTPERRARFQNQKDLYRAIELFVEHDTPNWDLIADDEEEILGQIRRDTRALLKGIGVSASHNFEECQKQLIALGFVQNADAA